MGLWIKSAPNSRFQSRTHPRPATPCMHRSVCDKSLLPAASTSSLAVVGRQGILPSVHTKKLSSRLLLLFTSID